MQLDNAKPETLNSRETKKKQIVMPNELNEKQLMLARSESQLYLANISSKSALACCSLLFRASSADTHL